MKSELWYHLIIGLKFWDPMSSSKVVPPSDHTLEPGERKPTSLKKVEANRRNARLSTGPRTEHGKRAVARNAIKHGLLARQVVITAGDGEEDLQEFEALLDRIWQECEPVGVLEETFSSTDCDLLVETRASAACREWRDTQGA